MNDNQHLLGVICDLLKKNSALVLTSIIFLEGSSPRHNGAKMIVASDGRSYGTIGGSLMEAAAINEAQYVLAEKQSRLMDFSLNGKDANSMGMICGGKTTILLDYISATPANLEFFQKWQKTLQNRRDFYVVTHLVDYKSSMKVTAHSLVLDDKEVISSGQVVKEDIDFLKLHLSDVHVTCLIEHNATTLVVDPIRKVKTVYLFGAGHVAVPTAHIAALTGFKVIVLDDRPDYSNTERFPDADSVRVLSNFSHALEGLEIDSDSFIVIITRGHPFDRAVLEQSLRTRAGYIGMISSTRKKATIYSALLEKGITQADLDKVHSPIGIPLGGETPEEIAVSIVAELIKERNKKQQ